MGLWIAKFAKLLDDWGVSLNHWQIIMLGLDAAGKTTILYKLKLNETITTIPTISFNVEEVRLKNVSFTVWDVGGQSKIRSRWHHYYANSDALIFVVDSSDRERLKEAADELHAVLNDDRMRAIPVLVFANKQDLPGAVAPSELIVKLRLRDLVHRNKWHVQASNAVSGEGLYEGLETVASLCHEHQRVVR